MCNLPNMIIAVPSLIIFWQNALPAEFFNEIKHDGITTSFPGIHANIYLIA